MGGSHRDGRGRRVLTDPPLTDVPYCSNCGHEVSPGAPACPHCGRRLPWHAAHPPAGTSPTSQPNVLAIVALVASITGVTVFPFVGSVVGLVVGYIARGRLARDPGSSGRSLVGAALIIGWVGVALGVIAFVMFVLLGLAFFSLL